MGTADPLLSVEHLITAFDAGGRLLPAVQDVSFTIAPGETLGIVGESGCGKTITALSVVRLIQPPGRILSGRVLFQGRDLLSLDQEGIRSVRGAGIGFIFQEPGAALSPVYTIGDQIAEAIVAHGQAGWSQARRRAVDLLDAARVPDAAVRARDYPHQLSGGLRQRVMIAVALACGPPLVIADEPTTALDVTTQAAILELLRDLRDQRGLAVLLITHDFGVVAQEADTVAVMYAGRIVEHGRTLDVLRAPRHPYTQGLLACIPGRGIGTGAESGTRLRAVDGLVPSLGHAPAGCAFERRCPVRMERCRTELPAPSSVSGPGEAPHAVHCHLFEACGT
jgi:oligopeptide/dipeptide ABC transporter ATP-binding protein